MMKLFWTPEALQDRDAIYDYIEVDNPRAALALDELFSEKAQRLPDHPALGNPGRVAGTRELIAHQNYTIAMASFRKRLIRVASTVISLWDLGSLIKLTQK